MAQPTYIARKGEDADFAALTVDSLVVNTVSVTAGAITLADAELITLGTGSDVTIQWDGTNLLMAAAADDSVFEIGDSAATQKSFDLKWYGNGANGADYVLYDASGNIVEFNGVDLRIQDGDFLRFGDGSDVAINWDGSKLEMESTAAASTFNVGAASFVFNTTLHGTFTTGVNDTGYDVQFFGATTGCSLLWDESEDQLVVTGPADVPALKIAGAGSKSAAAFAAAGTAWTDGNTPEFIADQMYLLLDVGGTVYRLPLWANA